MGSKFLDTVFPTAGNSCGDGFPNGITGLNLSGCDQGDFLWTASGGDGCRPHTGLYSFYTLFYGHDDFPPFLFLIVYIVIGFLYEKG
jgi:hypothetical protein